MHTVYCPACGKKFEAIERFKVLNIPQAPNETFRTATLKCDECGGEFSITRINTP